MTATVSRPEISTSLAYKHFVNETLWKRLTERIVKDEGFDLALAEQIMNEAIAFLLFCAKNPAAGYSPSPAVDIAWHNFILYTREYAQWCKDNAGWFIHHCPNDEPGMDDIAPSTALSTVVAMKAQGFKVNEALWVSKDHNCHRCSGDQCRVGGGGFSAAKSGQRCYGDQCRGSGSG